MKLTVRDVVGAMEHGVPLVNNVKLKNNPAFWFGRQVRRLLVEYTDYQKARLELIKQFGHEWDQAGEKLMPGSDQWKVDPENMAKFNVELAGLLSSEIEVTVEQRLPSYLGLETMEPAIFETLWFLFLEGPDSDLVSGAHKEI